MWKSKLSRMKAFVSIGTLALAAASMPALAQVQYPVTQILSCDGGAAQVTQQVIGPVSHYTVTVNNPRIVAYLASLLSSNRLLAGLDRSRYLGGTDGTSASYDEFYIYRGQLATFMDIANGGRSGQLPPILLNNRSYVIQNGRGMPPQMIGKIEVQPGFYTRREGRGLKISIYRMENRALGIPGIYLGDWYFQNCESR